MTYLANAKLRSEDLDTIGQEDIDVGTLEKYIIVLLFKLQRRKRCIVEIMLTRAMA